MARFAYIQTRIQARHGERLDDTNWRQLEAQQGLSNFLHIARETSLRPWVLGLHGSDDIHTLEKEILRQFRHYIEEVSNWQPREWRAATRWLGILVDLPVLEHLLTGEAVPSWVSRDDNYKNLTESTADQRRQAMLQTAYAPLAESWSPETALTEEWLRCWRKLWPQESKPVISAVEKVTDTLIKHRNALTDTPGQDTRSARKELATRLNYLFRRFSQQPAAVFAHLGMVAIDIERLRGNLSRRSLFDTREKPGVEGRAA